MALLAELDVYHSRAIAPTRRVALGDSHLPVDPSPGPGGILLGAMVAAHAGELDPDLAEELEGLMVDLADGLRIAQPRLRYRYQIDRVGLLRSRFRLVGSGDRLDFDFDQRCNPTQAVLGALYATGRLELPTRLLVMATLRRALRWRGPLGDELVENLVEGYSLEGMPFAGIDDPRAWALTTLGLAGEQHGGDAAVRKRFRTLLRQAHPDHGGESEAAARRIAELAEARRILLGAGS